MRKLGLCVLMMTLFLTSCGGEAKGNEAEELALTVRGEYLASQNCSGTAVVTADYGQRVYEYQMDFQWDEEQTLLTLTAPETVAGMSARLSAREGSKLEYDGMILETGPLNDSGLTPVSALPALLTAIREGYLDACQMEEQEDGRRVLRLLSRNPELELGKGQEITLWISEENHALLRGEISQDGFCVIRCEFLSFSKDQ